MRKGVVSLSIVVLLFVESASALLSPEVVQAQFTVSDPTQTGVTVSNQVDNVSTHANEVAQKNVGQVLLETVLGSLINGFSYFTRKLAYDGAKYLASGGKGQSAQVYQDGFGEYLKKTTLDSVAATVEEIGKPFGLNLCSPPNLNFQLYLQVGLRQMYPDPNKLGGAAGPQPSCDFQSLQGNWQKWSDPEKFANSIGLGGASAPTSVAELFTKNVQINQTDFGIAIGAISQVDRIQVQQREAASLERTSGEGFKAVTDLIGGNVKTPAQVIKKESESLTSGEQTKLTSQQVAGIYASGAKQVVIQAGSVFLNTFVSELLQNIMTKGIVPTATNNETGLATSDYYASPGGSSRIAADRAFSFLLTSPPSQVDNFDILSEFRSCSDHPGSNNCVIDDGLYQAYNRESQGQSILTVGEALTQGLLHADWLLIPPTRVVDNGDPRACRQGKYCYSNLQKLRKADMLPLGFEIAALRSNPDQPWTLGDVVKNFENCGPRNPDGSIVPNAAAFPFCHLINPNWILKVPVMRCEAKGFGPELVSGNAKARIEECADVSTCVAYDASGACVQYGYCTKEENIWKFPGASCEPEYATCKTYTNTENGAIASYLSRTLDFGSCSADSVGCRVYSTEQTNGAWLSEYDFGVSLSFAANGTRRYTGAGSTFAHDKRYYTAAGRNPIVHLTGAAGDLPCSAGDAGCHALILGVPRADGGYSYGATVNEKVAAPSLNCYDTNLTTPAVDYPETEAELELLKPSAACSNFASVCVASEVGCDGYTPVAGGTSVPAVVGANACTAECVGYNAFAQVASNFEEKKDPVYFIPSRGKECSGQYVGCSEFTNLDDVAKGGEGREYFTSIKYCEKPAADTNNDKVPDNQKTFYTWEGSNTTGFVLRIHKLKVVSATEVPLLTTLLGSSALPAQTEIAQAGSPAYSELTTSALTTNYAECNKANYTALINGTTNAADPDCREFLDDTGKTFYRLLAKTVTVSDQCVPFRASQTNLVVDPAITDGTLCTSGAKGLFQGGSCSRCLGGGAYVDGACVYSGIKSESTQCPATANECRAYTGNFAGNVRDVFSYTFEPTNASPTALTAVQQSILKGVLVNESIQVGGHSVAGKVTGANTVVQVKIPDNAVPKDDVNTNLYELHFWARADQTVNLAVTWDARPTGASFVGQRGSTTGGISLGAVWREYVLYSQAFADASTAQIPTSIEFAVAGAGRQLFVDNVSLRHVADTRFIIKDSWKTTEGYDVPLTCDSNPVDGFPGEQLGCAAYNAESNGTTVYATGFEKLCRPEAIGCQAVFDTYNTAEKTEVAYHVWCDQNIDPATKVCTVTETPDPALPPPAALGTCTVGIGETGCFVDKIVLPAGVHVTPGSRLEDALIVRSPETVFFPADTPTTTPFYLAVRKQFLCDGSKFLGCQELGLEEQVVPTPGANAYAFQSTFLINNPALYVATQQNPRPIMCGAGEVGCGAFTNSNSTAYFKDPKVSGNKLCEYRTDDGTGAIGTGGWFLKDVGTCSNNALVQCTTDAGCTSGGTCTNIGNVACYPRYVVAGGAYGLQSNSSAAYEGFVGACPVEADQCTEFIDRVDTSTQFPSGKPYDIIYNDAVKAKAGECGGQASLRDGCVLLDNSENPQKLYDTAATYAKSEQRIRDNKGSEGASGVAMVNPITAGNLDANIIIKVDRDRQCSEWLGCKDSVTYTDENGKPVTYCKDYDICIKAQGGKCIQFATRTGTVQSQYLDFNKYTTRDTSWYGDDYTGFSLYNRYPVADYVYGAFDGSNSTFLAYHAPDSVLRLSGGYDYSCVNSTSGAIKANWESCGPGGGGRCYNGACIYRPQGSFDAGVTASTVATAIPQALETTSCKNFPEEDSPFPATIDTILQAPATARVSNAARMTRLIFSSKKSGFSQANACQQGNCSCEYQKIEQKDGLVDYWPLSVPNPIKAICVGGNKSGFPCVVSATSQQGVGNECGTPGDTTSGICTEATRIEKRIGSYGFCLEKDLSHPINGGSDFACLTWLPLQLSATQIDLFNQSLSAGYYPSEAYDSPDKRGQIYCSVGTARSNEVDTVFAAGTNLVAGLTRTALDAAKVRSTDPTPADPPFTVYPTFGSLFQSSGYPVTSGDHGMGSANDDCRDSSVRASTHVHDLNNFVCRSSNVSGPNSELKTLYSILQYWSWKYISKNAMVLRVEPYDVLDEDHYLLERNTDAVRQIPKDDSAGGYISDLHQKVTEDEIQDVRVVPLTGKATLPIDFDGNPDPTAEKYRMSWMSQTFVIPFSELRSFAKGSGTVSVKRITGVGRTVGERTVDLQNRYSGTTEFSRSNASCSGCTVLTYVLKRSSSNSGVCGGLLSNCSNYGNSRVERRYVTTWFVSGDPTAKFNQTGVPTSATEDIFSSDCSPYDASYAPKTGWYAVAMDFDSRGEFLGYTSRSCNIVGDIVPVAIVATVYDQCVEFQQVYDESKEQIAGTTNMALTDRVWAYARSIASAPFTAFTRLTEMIPYGSIDAIGSNMSSILSSPYLFDATKRGAPFKCQPGSLDQALGPALAGGESCDGYGSAVGGTIADTVARAIADTSSGITARGVGLLQQLFAKSFFDKHFAPRIVGGGADSDDGVNGYDVSGSSYGMLALVPPQVYSLDPTTCSASSDVTKATACRAGEDHNVSVNGINGTTRDYDNDGKPENDTNVNGTPDNVEITSIGTLSATLKFFAFADHNRMPLKRILVEWGDSRSDVGAQIAVSGFYKNRKPFCSPSESGSGVGECYTGTTSAPVYSGVTCTQDASCQALGSSYHCSMASGSFAIPNDPPRFGNAPRACIDEPFSYTHIYTCTDDDYKVKNERGVPVGRKVSDITNIDVRDRLSRLYGADAQVCVYKPRVQVQDNWGFCNGSIDPATGNYNKQTAGYKDSFGCLSSKSQPWTYFAGEVVVVKGE